MVPVCHPSSSHVFFCALLLVRWSSEAEDVTESDLPLYLGWWLSGMDHATSKQQQHLISYAIDESVCSAIVSATVLYSTSNASEWSSSAAAGCVCRFGNTMKLRIFRISRVTRCLLNDWWWRYVGRSVGLWTIGSGIELAAQVDGYLATAHDLLHLSTGCFS